MSYFSKLSQNVVESTLNSAASPATNIAGGATWSGTADGTLNVAGIQLMVFADQNCTIYVDQSPNTAPNWDCTDTYEYYANTSFGVTVQAVGAQFRARITNNNPTVATSTFRVTSILCPIVEAVPRSLDQWGHFKTSINRIQDLYGFAVECTPVGEMRTVVPNRLVGTSFDGTTVDPNFWEVANVGSGTTTQANAQIVLSTGSVANGATSLHSIRRARYVSGAAMVFRAVVTLSSGNANNKRRWGIAFGTTMPTITDGAYFQLDGTTFSIVTLRSTVETKVDSGNFNGTLGASYSLGTTVHTFEIYWTNSKVWFVISNEVLHTVSATSATWAATMAHYIFMDTVNTSGISSTNTLTCRVASIRRLGPLQTLPIGKYQSGLTAGVVCKYSAGNLHKIILSGMTSGAIITAYDGTSTGATIIWASGTINVGAQALVVPVSIDFNGMPFYTGLFFTITGATCNVLVIYE